MGPKVNKPANHFCELNLVLPGLQLCVCGRTFAGVNHRFKNFQSYPGKGLHLQSLNCPALNTWHFTYSKATKERWVKCFGHRFNCRDYQGGGIFPRCLL